MKRSYSTAILQDSAWRLWAAEQLVLTTLPADKGRGCEWVPADGERAAGAWAGVGRVPGTLSEAFGLFSLDPHFVFAFL